MTPPVAVFAVTVTCLGVAEGADSSEPGPCGLGVAAGGAGRGAAGKRSPAFALLAGFWQQAGSGIRAGWTRALNSGQPDAQSPQEALLVLLRLCLDSCRPAARGATGAFVGGCGVWQSRRLCQEDRRVDAASRTCAGQPGRRRAAIGPGQYGELGAGWLLGIGRERCECTCRCRSTRTLRP